MPSYLPSEDYALVTPYSGHFVDSTGFDRINMLKE